MKRCPFCSEEIQDAAKKCKHCGEYLTHVDIKAPIDTVFSDKEGLFIKNQIKKPGTFLFWYLVIWQFGFGFLITKIFPNFDTDSNQVWVIYGIYALTNSIISIKFLTWLAKIKKKSNFWLLWGLIPIPILHVFGAYLLGKR